MAIENPTRYEEISSQVASAFYESVEGILPEQVKFGRNNKWLGKSGFVHQIDVSVVGNRDIILIECKCWNKKVKASEILAFNSRIIDIGAALEDKVIHPIMITNLGFQSGVPKLANYFNIRLGSVTSVNQFGFSYKTETRIHLAVGKLALRGIPVTISVGNNPEIDLDDNSS